jgi:hypothetical protein
MNWIRTILDKARERRELKQTIDDSKHRLKNVGIVYKALQDLNGKHDLFIAASTPEEGAYVCNLKPSIAREIRDIILEDLEKTINAEIEFKKEMEAKL